MQALSCKRPAWALLLAAAHQLQAAPLCRCRPEGIRSPPGQRVDTCARMAAARWRVRRAGERTGPGARAVGTGAGTEATCIRACCGRAPACRASVPVSRQKYLPARGHTVPVLSPCGATACKALRSLHTQERKLGRYMAGLRPQPGDGPGRAAAVTSQADPCSAQEHVRRACAERERRSTAPSRAPDGDGPRARRSPAAAAPARRCRLTPRGSALQPSADQVKQPFRLVPRRSLRSPPSAGPPGLQRAPNPGSVCRDVGDRVRAGRPLSRCDTRAQHVLATELCERTGQRGDTGFASTARLEADSVCSVRRTGARLFSWPLSC